MEWDQRLYKIMHDQRPSYSQPPWKAVVAKLGEKKNEAKEYFSINLSFGEENQNQSEVGLVILNKVADNDPTMSQFCDTMEKIGGAIGAVNGLREHYGGNIFLIQTN